MNTEKVREVRHSLFGGYTRIHIPSKCKLAYLAYLKTPTKKIQRKRRQVLLPMGDVILRLLELLYIIPVSRPEVERDLFTSTMLCACGYTNQKNSHWAEALKPGWKINGRSYPHFNRVPSSPVFWFLEEA